MSRDRLLTSSERWFTAPAALLSADFRDDMGDAVVEAYRDRARDALQRGGSAPARAALWLRALRRLAAQRPRPSACARPRRGGAAATGAATSSSRRAGCGARRRLPSRRSRRSRSASACSPSSTRPSQKVLIDPMPYRRSGRSVLRLARLRTDSSTSSAARSPAPTSSELQQADRRHRGRRGAAAVPRRHLLDCAKAPIRWRSP